MIRLPPRSTPLYSSAASDVYKRQETVTHPPRHLPDARKFIVHTRHDVGGYLDVAPVLLLGPNRRLHRGRRVFYLGEPEPPLRSRRFEVKPKGVQIRTDLVQGFFSHITRRDKGRKQTGLLEGAGDIRHVIYPHDRIIVCPYEPAKLMPTGHGDCVVRTEIGELLRLPPRISMGYLPILTAGTQDVAA